VSRLSRKCGTLNVSQPYGPPWPVTGIALTLPYFNLTPWLLVRKRTIPTERPPHVGEVSANFLRIEDVAWLAQLIPTAVNFGFLDRFTLLYKVKTKYVNETYKSTSSTNIQIPRHDQYYKASIIIFSSKFINPLYICFFPVSLHVRSLIGILCIYLEQLRKQEIRK
jgi:hypothetical protein